MPDAPQSSASSPTPEEGRLAGLARTLASLARRLTTGVAILTITSAAAGGLLWVLLWWPLHLRAISLLGAAVTLVPLLAPGGVLALFYQGLRDLQALPHRLSDRTTRTLEQSTKTARTVRHNTSGLLGRLWNVVRQIWALRKILLENRAFLVRYGILLRFVTPGFLLLVVFAAGISLLIVPLALAAGLLTLLW